MEVGFEQPSYNVVEGVGQFNVCVVVTVPPNAVPLERMFSLSVSTRPGTAGMYVFQPGIFFSQYTVFLRSDAAATIYFTVRFVRLLFEGGIYFFGKPGDINDSWIGYK